jgi:hypothetical protein
VAVRPAAGFKADNGAAEGDEVEVEFESDTQKSKIAVRLVNGVPSATVEEGTGDDNRVENREGADDTTVDDSNNGHGSEHKDDHSGKSVRS